MGINIKTPSDDIAGKGHNPKSKVGGGVWNGEDGYQKRTPSPNAVPEKTYESDKPRGGLDIKSPAKPVKK